MFLRIIPFVAADAVRKEEERIAAAALQEQDNFDEILGEKLLNRFTKIVYTYSISLELNDYFRIIIFVIYLSNMFAYFFHSGAPIPGQHGKEVFIFRSFLYITYLSYSYFIISFISIITFYMMTWHLNNYFTNIQNYAGKTANFLEMAFPWLTTKIAVSRADATLASSSVKRRSVKMSLNTARLFHNLGSVVP